MNKVVICQYRLLHYRTQLFDSLRDACRGAGIELCLVHGGATRREARKKDEGRLDWATVVRNRYLEAGSKDVLWQPFPAVHRDAGLVVLMQENRLLSNYPWLWGLRGAATRVAYWGHGRNFQSQMPTGLRERWKRTQVGLVDWWFAYTQMTRDILLSDGYPDERITVLDNAIDNEGFKRDLEAIEDGSSTNLRAAAGLGETGPLALFCGSLYPEKRLDFMIEAADAIRQTLPDFQLVVIGDGPSRGQLEQAAASRPWLKPLGSRFGIEKAGWFKAADVVLNPGLVGLHVLDAFCAGLPMVTTADANHSPEIAYLQDGVNGLVVRGGVQDYAHATVNLLADPAQLASLKRAALQASGVYTLENMVGNFLDGFERCLATPKRR